MRWTRIGGAKRGIALRGAAVMYSNSFMLRTVGWVVKLHHGLAKSCQSGPSCPGLECVGLQTFLCIRSDARANMLCRVVVCPHLA